MLIIGVAGGAGSGKTTVVRKLVEKFSDNDLTILPQDSYYFDTGYLPLEERLKVNYDHPDSIEFDLMIKHLNELKKGNEIEEPIYSYQTCMRSEETKLLRPNRVIIVEGILVLCCKELRELMDLKVYVDAEADERLIRIINRDFRLRGRLVEKTLERYRETVKPMHAQFVEPTRRFADLIVPQGGKNHVAIDILAKYIQSNIYNSRKVK